MICLPPLGEFGSISCQLTNTFCVPLFQEVLAMLKTTGIQWPVFYRPTVRLQK